MNIHSRYPSGLTRALPSNTGPDLSDGGVSERPRPAIDITSITSIEILFVSVIVLVIVLVIAIPSDRCNLMGTSPNSNYARSGRAIAEANRLLCLRANSRDKTRNAIYQLVQVAFEEMICAFDDLQLFRLVERREHSLEIIG